MSGTASSTFFPCSAGRFLRHVVAPRATAQSACRPRTRLVPVSHRVAARPANIFVRPHRSSVNVMASQSRVDFGVANPDMCQNHRRLVCFVFIRWQSYGRPCGTA